MVPGASTANDEELIYDSIKNPARLGHVPRRKDQPVSAKYILAIDQGTTSSRAIVFDRRGRPLAVSQRELPQIYPQDGWVEQDPEFIWSDVAAVCRMALDRAGLRAADLAGLGVTNQRETTLLWERETGRPL